MVTQLAVYRDVIEAVLAWLPSRTQMHEEIKAVNDRLCTLEQLHTMAQGALTKEGINSALSYVKSLEKIADLLADAEDENGTPDLKAIYLAMDIAKSLREGGGE